jgi:AbrB family looped-hinge helix DNA binding protein
VKTTVSSNGQFVLPAKLRQQDAIRPGDQFAVERVGAGEYLFKRLATNNSEGVLDWLLRCPAKDWFQPIASESTADL